LQKFAFSNAHPKKEKTFSNQDFADPCTITSLQMLDLSLGRAFGRTSA
jgi:hypothetical protein